MCWWNVNVLTKDAPGGSSSGASSSRADSSHCQPWSRYEQPRSSCLSSVVFLELQRARARATAVMDRLLTTLEALCAPGASPLIVPIAATLPFKGEVLLREKLVIPFKDTLQIPKGLTIPFKGTVPINTQVRVPLFPHGPAVNVPLNTTVPVETQISLPAGLLIPVDTHLALPAGLTIRLAVDIGLDQPVPVPFEVCRPESLVQQVLAKAIQQVREARDSLR
jgi:hypothetical protein